LLGRLFYAFGVELLPVSEFRIYVGNLPVEPDIFGG
jgi:hypothetical protein